VNNQNHGRLPPQALDSERYVLGAMLQDATSVDSALEKISSEDFYLEKHRILFEAMTHLSLENDPVDYLTVEERLRSSGKLELSGGRMYMMELLEDVASSASIQFHCEIIKEKSLLRTLIQSSNEVISKSFDPTCEPEDVLNYAVQNILSVSEKKVKGGLIPLGNILQETIRKLETLKAMKLQVFQLALTI
jgi:replicative DNA helicase